ncbi:DUF5789 family protein [Halobacterium jilantaiense]|uniref:DUF2795 domain-containing protein n=1 Tax=Halobacterium jilantaiense TaxID=355548 RepID=A0A1I0ML66_9EURY|nr:hypothetical protein [Halobacterium jilantaiense]SEV88824.1 hypothetical protein SAMN04487945_0148 [Halobacterium jilantaiense]
MAPEDEPEADSTDSDDSRSQGIELGALDDDLEAHDYPASASALVDEYGDREIELPGGSQRVGEVLGLYEEDDQEFDDAEAVRTAIHNLVGTEAVGRDNYSDRGGSTPDESTDDEHESF